RTRPQGERSPPAGRSPLPPGPLTSTFAPGTRRAWPSVTTFSPGWRPDATIVSLPWVRATTTRRFSTVASGFTTNTYDVFCWPAWTDWDGTRMASASVGRVSTTLTN